MSLNEKTGAKVRGVIDGNDLSEAIIGCGMQVHRGLEQGLLESAYGDYLCFELSKRFYVRKKVPLPLVYEKVALDCVY
ncbi:GxxExxY protein [Umezakia ovalisporum]|jgi:GxxExxY protein|uniref:GxxExxY protein n=1 Tax=Umezakia ovalisporum TaxID=75695 RepID=UPI0035B81B60